MTPVLLQRNEVDDRRWNTAIAASQQAVMYGFSWYLDIVCEDWAAVVWPAADDYQVIMPLPVKRRWGHKIIYQPFFCQYLGMFSVRDINAELACSFLKVADSFTDFISSYRFSPQNHAVVSEAVLHLPHWQFKVNHTNWLHLENTYESIAAGYSHDRRNNLKRAMRHAWEIEKPEHLEPLIDLFRKHHEKNIEGGVRDATYDTLTRLLQHLLKKGYGELWFATRNAKPEAGVFIGKAGSQAIYLFNAASEEGRRGNARTFLLDQYFQRHAGEGMIFDFESPEVPSISGFYASFGAESKAFLSVRKNTLRFPLKQFNAVRVKILKVWKWF